MNLKRGVPEGETTVSSLAGAGSLSVEFSVLSALTGDGVFAEVNKQGGTWEEEDGGWREGKGGSRVLLLFSESIAGN